MLINVSVITIIIKTNINIYINIYYVNFGFRCSSSLRRFPLQTSALPLKAVTYSLNISSAVCNQNLLFMSAKQRTGFLILTIRFYLKKTFRIKHVCKTLFVLDKTVS